MKKYYFKKTLCGMVLMRNFYYEDEKHQVKVDSKKATKEEAYQYLLTKED